MKEVKDRSRVSTRVYCSKLYKIKFLLAELTL